MSRKSRCVLLSAALAISSLLIAAVPARAQQPSSLFFSQAAAKAASSDSLFLTNGLVQGGQQAPPPSGGANHQGFGVGLKGGFLNTKVPSTTAQAVSNKGGWIFGLWFGGNRGGVVGVEGEIMYAKKSSAVGTNVTDAFLLEIPILARINMGSESLNGVNVYGLIGPGFDILLRSKLNGADVKAKYESLDIGLIIGGGVEITRFLIEAQFNKGIKNVLKGTGATTTDSKSRAFAMMFGVRFN